MTVQFDALTETLLAIVSGVLGLIVGSFLNVVIYRVPAKKSIVSPGSACPNCGHPIAWYDNIPLISWLLLRGKCRNCAQPISVRYPLIELATGLYFAAIALRFPPVMLHFTTAQTVASALVLIAFLYLAAISIALAMIDLDTHTLPNPLVLPAYVVGAALLGAAAIIGGNYGDLLRAGIGAVVLFALYFLLALIYPGGMGFGDVKLAGVLGLFLGWLGWGALCIGAFAAFFLGGIFGIVLLTIRRAGRKTRIPFGPWMLAGAGVGIFAGQQVWIGYLSLFGLA